MMPLANCFRLLPTIAAFTLALPAFFASPADANSPTQFPARPADCKNFNGPFEKWLAEFRRESQQRGVSARTLSLALDGMTHDPAIIRIDRGQSFFAQSFLDFHGKLATPNRVNSGKRQMQRHADLFARAKAEFGVPAPIITAFWALESDFGRGMGKRPVLRSLATLAWDCRRSEMFREELHAALAIIDRGDLTPDEMVSSWAGELGQTQFLPTHYLRHAVDYDGDGKRNLFKSDADVIGSTANFIRSLGWTRGQPWLEEVLVPSNLDWQRASLDQAYARSEWAKAGVKYASGAPLPDDALLASLILLQGRGGPAFLAYPNFKIFTEWNQSLNYAVTAAYLATRLAGARAMNRGPSPAEPMSREDIMTLQTLLARNGYDMGRIDGLIGARTRAAVRAEQIKFGLPADSYPTAELIERLRRQR